MGTGLVTEPRILTAALLSRVRALLEPSLPPNIEACWHKELNEAIASASGVEIGWYDYDLADLIGAAVSLRWLFTVAAGLEHIPRALLRERGVRVSNGSGLNAANVADYAVMGVLVAAKGFKRLPADSSSRVRAL